MSAKKGDAAHDRALRFLSALGRRQDVPLDVRAESVDVAHELIKSRQRGSSGPSLQARIEIVASMLDLIGSGKSVNEAAHIVADQRNMTQRRAQQIYQEAVSGGYSTRKSAK